MTDFTLLALALVFVFGLVIGSFLNVLIYRLPQNKSLFGCSFCPNCKKQIRWFDNIPLVSFIILGGRCRFCHSPISFQYPIVELLTAVLFSFTSFLLPEENIKYFPTLFYYFFIISTLIVVFFIDLKHGIIPDKIIFPAILFSLFYLFIIHNSLFLIHLSSALGASAFLGFLFLITRGRGMGLGDVKFAFLMGLFLGFPSIIPAFYLAFLTGAVVSLILILAGRKKFGQTISFGPFLVLGTILTFFFHEKIFLFFPWLHLS